MPTGVRVYSCDDRHIATMDGEPLRALMANHRVRAVRDRRGELRRVYLQGDGALLSVRAYQGQRYSYREHTRVARNIWTLRKINTEDRPIFMAVLDSVVAA